MPVVPLVVATLTKGLVYSLSSSVQVEGLENLLEALRKGKGVLTVSNHISVIDEPSALSVALPWRYLLDAKTTRWTMAAADVCFTNPASRAFFNAGQVIETFRSKHDPERAGIYQIAVDRAIEKLDKGLWLHIFPEAFVNQHPEKELLRFRWGVSRILMETTGQPEIIPMWLEGFDTLMPEPRDFPRFVPRFWRGARIRIVFGEPITGRVQDLVQEYQREREKSHIAVASSIVDSLSTPTIALYDPVDGQTKLRPRPPNYEGDTLLAKEFRTKIAAVLKEEVEKLGRSMGKKTPT